MTEKSESADNNQPDFNEPTGIPNPFTELVTSFRELKDAPRGFWYTNYIYWLDGVAYFGMLTLLAMYFHDIMGMTDDTGHKIVSAYMALITGFMLIFGPISDKLGVRKSLLVSVTLYIVGRAALPLAPHVLPAGSSMLMIVVFAGLLLAAAGNGFMQPASYAGVRKFSDKKTATMGYGLLYAGMNLGIVFIGFASSRIRSGLDLGENFRFEGFGIEGVMWFCVLVNVVMLLGLVFFFTPKVEREAEQAGAAGSDEEDSGQSKASEGVSGNLGSRIAGWFKTSPLSNSRFMFFIFALMPVQTPLRLPVPGDAPVCDPCFFRCCGQQHGGDRQCHQPADHCSRCAGDYSHDTPCTGISNDDYRFPGIGPADVFLPVGTQFLVSDGIPDFVLDR